LALVRLAPALRHSWGWGRTAGKSKNQGFNDAKHRYGLEHICHHAANRVLITWRLVLLALVLERLYPR
jgi:hypothetical protein